MQEEQSPINFTTLLAFAVLIGLVLLLPVYWKWIGYEPSQPPPETARVELDTTTAAAPQTMPGTVNDEPRLTEPETTSSTPVSGMADGPFVVDSLWEDGYVAVSTPHIEALIAHRGARLARLVLRDYIYNDAPRKGQPIVLIDTTDAAGPRYEFFGHTVDLSAAPFVPDRDRIDVTVGDSAVVSFAVTSATGDTWLLTYTFFGDRYDFRTRLVIPRPWEDKIEREMHFGWQGGLWPTEPDPGDDNGSFAAVTLMGRDLETVSGVDREEPAKEMTGVTHWVGVRTKYFVCAVIPSAPGDGFRSRGATRPYRYDGETIELKQFTADVRHELFPGAPIDVTHTIYTGPIDYDLLKKYDVGLEEMVDLGWRWLVRPFAVAILWLFQALHKVVPNYGIVIILFGVLIKAIFHPLTKKQMRSMRRMQALQPRMEKLKEKHKKDPQKMNAEVMKMYKEAGVNPMAGCLPLLPQLPIFYALFQVFRTTIELRGASFVGWLTDLSVKDPYYILPIIMTVSMFVQQKLSTKDPKQKMITYMMPLLFGFLFRNFPAGLTLYWTVFNISSVIEQTWLIGHPSKDDEVNGETVPARK